MTSSTERIWVGRHHPRVVTLALAAFCLLVGIVGCEAEGPARANLVLITIDRLAADRLSCFGGGRSSGGSVCALGRQGTLFAWTASPGGGEASGAATVLTGLPESLHGVGNDGQSFLADAHPTIAEGLSQAGYSTAAFVASPRVNHSRRLDQGFDRYDDRLASPNRWANPSDDPSSDSSRIDFAGIVRSWIDTASSPWFIWIHADREAGLVELDRLLSRLSQTLDREGGGPGILFLALRGEREPTAPEIEATTDAEGTIGWRTHRVPLIWRPPTNGDSAAVSTPVSFRLASLMDIAPTLRAAAHLPPTAASTANGGRDLSTARTSMPGSAESAERFLRLMATGDGTDVGLASQNHLYVRNASPLDGTGRPVETSSLIPLAARFSTLPRYDPLRDPTPNSARLEPGPWRKDVLGAKSPVPRLEFHLARQLETRPDTHHSKQIRRDSQ
jgi:hypothetical protein